MNYISTDGIPYFKDCAAIIEPFNLQLVELHIEKKQEVHVSVVIASKNPAVDIGVNDCSKAHHALQVKIAELLKCSEDDLYMEVCSPGLERNIKNGAEFAFFIGRKVRLWCKDVSDWVYGIVLKSDSSSVTLECDKGEVKTFVYENIAKAKFIHL